MASTGRKPIPKTQAEISNSLIDPYDKNLGNPNDTQQGFNRAEQTSWKGDPNKTFSVGIQDIDESIMYYFDNVIQPYVYQNGERISVPIIYGAPERWKSFQKDGYYRDKSGRIMSPIIMFKRNSLSKDRSVGNKLDANKPHNFGVYGKSYSSMNAYDNFSVLTNRIPDKQYYAVVIPDYVNIQYSCVIQTYYVEQLNKIVEAIEYASDSYWGNPQRYQFKAAIDSFTTVTELPQDDVRIVKSTFDIKIYGYIIPNTLQNNVASLKKFRNKAKLIFAMETVDDPIVLDPNVPVQVDDSGRPNALNARSIAANKYNTFTPFPRSSPTYIDGSAVNSAAASLNASLQALTAQLQALEARIAAIESNP